MKHSFCAYLLRRYTALFFNTLDKRLCDRFVSIRLFIVSISRRLRLFGLQIGTPFRVGLNGFARLYKGLEEMVFRPTIGII